MNLRQNLCEIKRLLQERKEAISALARFLISRGIASVIAEEIAQKIIQDELMRNFQEKKLYSNNLKHRNMEDVNTPNLIDCQRLHISNIGSLTLAQSQGVLHPFKPSSSHGLGHLKQILSERIKVTGDFSFNQAQQVVVIGPTGVGKTATIMKLAIHYCKQMKSVAIMSLDGNKKAFLHDWAIEQGMAYVQAIDEVEADLLLIDTEGCNFYQPHRIDALGETISVCGQNVEVLLALSASAKEVDLYGAIHQFSPLCPSSLLFTKFDETLASGVVVNISEKSDIPIRYIAYGFPLPGEVEIADAKAITHKILADFNEEEFQLLRQL